MHNSKQLINELRVKSHRITKIREAILNLLAKAKEPLSSVDIQALLENNRIPANKTTVYRELYFLQSQEMIRELKFSDAAKYYEIMPEDHHHHVVCVKCDKVEHVVLEKDLDLQEKAIAKNKKFKILNHTLEFYGICRSCQ